MMPALPEKLQGKRILWVGEKYFWTSLEEMGADVTMLPLDGVPLDWAELTKRAGFEPDILIYGDRSLPAPLLGIEHYPCLTVFLCVDTHIHSWYPFYAQAFDLCTVSLRDHMDSFRGKFLPDDRLFWMPPFARSNDSPVDAEKEWDLLFVGNVGADIFPVRTRMLEEIKKRIPGLTVKQGNYRDLYPRGRIILNIAERGDLNYRVFEVLGCGGCLLTPEIGHGQSDLFTDGVDLFTYPLNDVDALVARVSELLSQTELCEQVAKNGYEKVAAGHTAMHRAKQMAGWIDSVDHEKLIALRRGKAAGIHKVFLKLLYLHLAENTAHEALEQAYLKAARG